MKKKHSIIGTLIAAVFAVVAGAVVFQGGQCTLDVGKAIDIAAEEAAREVMADDDSAGDDDCAEVKP